MRIILLALAVLCCTSDAFAQRRHYQTIRQPYANRGGFVPVYPLRSINRYSTPYGGVTQFNYGYEAPQYIAPPLYYEAPSRYVAPPTGSSFRVGDTFLHQGGGASYLRGDTILHSYPGY